MLGVYNNSSEILWDELPDKFVLKCNHGCGYNIIVRNKKEIDREEICSKLDFWLSENYGVISGEWQYKKIHPLIIAEKFLETGDDTLPVDYKFMCSRGRVLYCMLVAGREDAPKRVCVDKNFSDLHYINSSVLEDYQSFKPKSYSEMWNIAAVLSEDFPIVRVDLYDIQGKPIFGELTFTPMGCINSYFSMDTQIKIGNQISLS